MSIKIISFFLLLSLIVVSPMPKEVTTFFTPVQVEAGSNSQPTTQKQESKFTEDNQKRLVEATPPPILQDSVERRNLIERLERNNKSDKIGYVFLLSDNGSIIANYTIKGKVSSLNSLLTTPDQQVCFYGVGSCSSDSAIVASPDLDGSYGENPAGVFFFTAEGNMIEWTGNYLYSEQQMTLSSAPVLTYNVK